MTGPPKDLFDSSNKASYQNRALANQYSNHAGNNFRESTSVLDKSEYSQSRNESIGTYDSKQYSVEDIEVQIQR